MGRSLVSILQRRDSRARAHSRTRKKRRALRGLFVHWTIFRFIDAQVTATERGGTGGPGPLSFPLPETPAHISARKGDKELEREVH